MKFIARHNRMIVVILAIIGFAAAMRCVVVAVEYLQFGQQPTGYEVYTIGIVVLLCAAACQYVVAVDERINGIID